MADILKLRVCILLVGCHLIGTAALAAVKLNGDLPLFGNVDPAFQLSPDGSRVIYVANQNSVMVRELFSVPITGGDPLPLNGSLPPGGNVLSGSARFVPDGSRVLYVADQHSDEDFELFSVASTGGPTTTLNEPLVFFGDVDREFRISPDGTRALYVADQYTQGVFELFNVSVTGGPVTRLNREQMVNGGDVVFGSAQFSPDGSRVIYLANQDSENFIELFAVDSAGGESVKLNSELAPLGRVFNEGLRFSPDGSDVLFTAMVRYHELTFQTIAELFIAPSTGGTPVPLHDPLPVGRNVLPASARFTPDGSRVLYVADQDMDEVYELFSVPRSGGSPTKLNSTLAMGRDVSDGGMQFSPDGTQVLYFVDQNGSGKTDLYRVPVDGGEAVWLGGAAGQQGSIDPLNVWWSSDGSHVVYRAGPGASGGNGLYCVATEDGTSVPLYVPSEPGPSVVNARVTPDNRHVVFLADHNADEVYELFAVPLTGGTPVRLSGDLVNGGDVTDWQISADGRYVVYRADQDLDERFELYSVSLAAGVPGDYNGDGRVDAGDYVRWRNHLGETDESAIHHNGDGDGVSLSDYAFWKARYGNPDSGTGGVASSSPGESPGAQFTVPEPAAWHWIGPVVIGWVHCGGWRRRLSARSTT